MFVDDDSHAAEGASPELTFDVSPDGPTRIIIAIGGEVDMATAPLLEECLRAHADRDVTVDLSGVGFLDSSGLATLLRSHMVFRDAGHTFRTTGERDNVLRVMDITGLTNTLHGDAEAGPA